MIFGKRWALADLGRTAWLVAEQYKLDLDDQLDYNRYLKACRNQLDVTVFEVSLAEGQTMMLDQALEEVQAFHQTIHDA
jgi:hypothetical protein